MEQLIEAQFEKMGARVKIAIAFQRAESRGPNRKIVRANEPQPIRVNVLRDRSGEYFEITRRGDVAMDVVEVRRRDRHLLLLAREGGWMGEARKSKFLCGHDERAWFVAAIPETASVSNVQDAKDALKPEAVWESIRAHGVPPHKRDLRWTKAFVRQGEWFFIPRPDAPIDEKCLLRDEPIRRGAGKPHQCQLMYRFGGEQVWVNRHFPNGLTVAEYRDLPPWERDRDRWRTMMRGARVYVKGAIRHSDHKTIWLSEWHEVVMNTETQAEAMRHVAFLD